MLEHRVIIFDGVCNLCNGAVNFIIQRDPQRKFKFAPMQSEAAQQLIDAYQASDTELDTLLLVEGDVFRVRTDAVLAIAAELTWPWRLFRVLTVFPAPFRDYFYRHLAGNRYRLFGKRAACMIPNEDIKSRFIDAT
ncbi:MAG: putative DCC family thiol-disulfide oxidoreductase YuxK [Candidatus Azotimanducaceae bacterium]|jgi:predicted DCC family thiol-disulfide oxidoreductase YuxK